MPFKTPKDIAYDIHIKVNKRSIVSSITFKFNAPQCGIIFDMLAGTRWLRKRSAISRVRVDQTTAEILNVRANRRPGNATAYIRWSQQYRSVHQSCGFQIERALTAHLHVDQSGVQILRIDMNQFELNSTEFHFRISCCHPILNRIWTEPTNYDYPWSACTTTVKCHCGSTIVIVWKSWLLTWSWPAIWFNHWQNSWTSIVLW